MNWLRSERVETGCDATPFCFIPRGVYGAYLADLVRGIKDSGALRHVRDRCVDLTEGADKVALKLESGATLAADLVVLATGNDSKRGLAGIPTLKAWSKKALSKVEGDGSVLIIGTGLTMVDQVLSLDRQGHRWKNQRGVAARTVTQRTPTDHSRSSWARTFHSVLTFLKSPLGYAPSLHKIDRRWWRLVFRHRWIAAAHSAACGVGCR